MGNKHMVKIDDIQYAQLMYWLADHLNEIPQGSQVSPTQAVRMILSRYFKSQETMRQVLRGRSRNEQNKSAV